MVQLAILTDLSKCFGCNACMLACKEWHSSGCYGPMTDLNPWGGPEPGKAPWSVFFMRVLQVEVGEFPNTKTFSVPISCFHCRNLHASLYARRGGYIQEEGGWCCGD